MIRFFALTMFLVLGMACSSSKQAVSDTSKASTLNSGSANPYEAAANQTKQTEDAVFFSIQRTACYGRCPVYTITVYQDGTAKYEGSFNVEYIGNFRGTVSKQIQEKLKEQANSIDYFNLKNEYNSSVTDLPSVFLYMAIGSKNKRIHARHGVPEQLREFANYADDLLKEVRWEKVND